MKCSVFSCSALVLPFFVLILNGCVRSPGVALIVFEFHNNGAIVHKFQKSIIDNSDLSQRWDLLKEAEIPAAVVTPGRSGDALLTGDYEIRMTHAGTVISASQVRDIALVPAAQGSPDWKIRHAEVMRIKQAAGVKE